MPEQSNIRGPSDDLWVRVNGKISGPHPRRAVRRAIRDGKLSPSAELAQRPTGPWKAVGVILARAGTPQEPSSTPSTPANSESSVQRDQRSSSPRWIRNKKWTAFAACAAALGLAAVGAWGLARWYRSTPNPQSSVAQGRDRSPGRTVSDAKSQIPDQQAPAAVQRRVDPPPSSMEVSRKSVSLDATDPCGSALRIAWRAKTDQGDGDHPRQITLRIVGRLADDLYDVVYSRSRFALRTHWTEFTTTGLATIWARDSGTIPVEDSRSGTETTIPLIEEALKPEERDLATRRRLELQAREFGNYATALLLLRKSLPASPELLAQTSGLPVQPDAINFCSRVLASASGCRDRGLGPVGAAISCGLGEDGVRKLLEIPEVRAALSEIDQKAFITAATTLVDQQAFLAVRDILSAAGLDVDHPDSSGRSALQVAASSHAQTHEELDTLIRCGAKVGFKDPRGRTAMHVAAESGNWQAINTLVKAGASLSDTDQAGATPLMVAVRAGKVKAMSKLLELGADVNQADSGGQTALHLASAAKSDDLVYLLLEAGANRLIKDSQGRRPGACGAPPDAALIAWTQALPKSLNKGDLALCEGPVLWAIEKQGDAAFVAKCARLDGTGLKSCTIEMEFDRSLGPGPGGCLLVVAVGTGLRREFILISPEGRVRWQAPTVGDDLRAEFGTAGHAILWSSQDVQLRSPTGQLLWQHALNGAEGWRQNEIRCGSVGQDGVSYVSMARELWCVDLTGSVKWRREAKKEGTTGQLCAFPFVTASAGGGVLAWLDDNRAEYSLLKLNAKGEIDWRKRLSAPICPASQLSNGQILAFCRDGINCLDGSGKRLWFVDQRDVQNQRSISAPDGATLVMCSNRLVLLEPGSDQPAVLDVGQSYHPRGPGRQLAFDRDGLLYALKGDEGLLVIDVVSLKLADLKR